MIFVIYKYVWNFLVFKDFSAKILEIFNKKKKKLVQTLTIIYMIFGVNLVGWESHTITKILKLNFRLSGVIRIYTSIELIIIAELTSALN